MAGTRGDKKQKEERGCSASARMQAQSWPHTYLDAGQVVLFHPSKWRSWLGHRLCLCRYHSYLVNCPLAPKKFRGLGQREERLVSTQMLVVFRAASRCAHLSVPQFPHQKGLKLLLSWHVVQGVNEVGLVWCSGLLRTTKEYNYFICRVSWGSQFLANKIHMAKPPRGALKMQGTMFNAGISPSKLLQQE